MRKPIGFFVITALAVALLCAALGVAAGQAEDAFAGRILVLTKKPPGWFKSPSAFISFLRANSAKIVYEDKNRTWRFETIAFFKKPLGDYEVTMVFYDVENGRGEGQRKFVNSYTQYTQDRNSRSLSGTTELIRPDFDANRTYVIIATSAGKEVAKGEFQTRGTTQASIEQAAYMEKQQAQMEKEMKELEQKAKEQEEKAKQQNKAAGDNLF
ncbi:MAG: hypothetical protein PHU25_00865 [Deltaproteobacteria bacterium]|nr:hypothetical protein [Deltaproteobacteria bacterium]